MKGKTTCGTQVRWVHLDDFGETPRIVTRGRHKTRPRPSRSKRRESLPDEDRFEDVDGVTGAVEATETRLVEFAGDVAFTLVVAVKWIEGGRAGKVPRQTCGMNARTR